LASISWWIAWFGPAPYSEHTFFPLWLGYILSVDGLAMRRAGTSLFARDRRRFASLFIFSIPLWWLFELANRYLDNWRYLMPRPYHPVEYALLASLAFSTVMPAIFVTAEFLRTFTPFAPGRRWLRIDPGRTDDGSSPRATVAPPTDENRGVRDGRCRPSPRTPMR
jgi:hypothetical protein